MLLAETQARAWLRNPRPPAVPPPAVVSALADAGLYRPRSEAWTAYEPRWSWKRLRSPKAEIRARELLRISRKRVLWRRRIVAWLGRLEEERREQEWDRAVLRREVERGRKAEIQMRVAGIYRATPHEHDGRVWVR